MENNINRYKMMRRKNLIKSYNQNQNQTPNQNQTQNQTVNQTEINVPELIASIKRSLYSDIDTRAKYWMEQKIGLLLNNNALMKKNTTELKIDYDNNSGGLSWLFKYNGQTVAYVDCNGFLYCSNILLNGVNLLNAIDNVIKINNDLKNLSDIYVRHVDLKDGTYELDVSKIISALAQLTAVEVGTINDCVIAPVDSSVTPTVSFIPVVKDSDSAMSIGKRIDFHDVLGDSLDYRIRLEAQSDGALRLYNYNASNHPLQIISNNGTSVQIQFGRSPQQNYMGIIQFNYAPSDGSTIGFGLWNHNNVVTINKYGIIRANGGLHASGDITTDNGILGAYVNTTGNHQFVKCGYDFNGRNYVFLAHNFSSDDSALNSASVGLNNGSYVRFGASDLSLFGSVSFDNNIYQLKDSLSANQSIFHYIGHALAESGRIGYTLKSPLTESYMNFAVNGTETLKMLNDLVESLQDFKCPNLEVSTNASVGGVLTVYGGLDVPASVNVLWDVQLGHDLRVGNTASIDNFDTTTKQMILRLMYPVGSVYMSATSHDNPNTIFGVNIGTWTEITNNRYLLASDSYQTLREEGGSFYHNHTTAAHTLTLDEIPSHNHPVRGSYNNQTDTNDEDCIGLAKWGQFATYEWNSNKGYGYTGNVGGGQAHTHGDTGTTMTQPPYYRVHAWYRSA